MLYLLKHCQQTELKAVIKENPHLCVLLIEILYHFKGTRANDKNRVLIFSFIFLDFKS